MQNLLMLLATIQEPSLDAFRDPARHLEKAMSAFVQGKDLAETLRPWPAKGPEGLAEMRDRLRKANATGAVLVAIEFEIYFVKDGKGIYCVSAAVYLGEKESSLLQYEARESGGKGTIPLEDFQGSLAGFGDAVRAILKGGDLPFADPKAVVKSAGWPSEAEREFAGLVEEGKKTFAAKKAEVAGLKYDGVRIDIDDILLVAVDKDGKGVGNFKSAFLLDGGKPAFQLLRLKG